MVAPADIVTEQRVATASRYHRVGAYPTVFSDAIETCLAFVDAVFVRANPMMVLAKPFHCPALESGREFAGRDTFEGTDTFKLKITMPNADTYVYYLDTDYYVPIKIDTKRIVRGAEREYETVLGDYKEVAGWYLPYSLEIGVKGSQDKAKTVFEKIEANVVIDDGRFSMPIIPKPSGQRP